MKTYWQMWMSMKQFIAFNNCMQFCLIKKNCALFIRFKNKKILIICNFAYILCYVSINSYDFLYIILVLFKTLKKFQLISIIFN